MSHIEVSELYKEYKVGTGVEIAVNKISFDVSNGEFVTLVGPSGCGKTTTLRCIAGLETPTRGTIKVDGEDVTDVPANKRNLAMMFQNIALYPHMTIFDNIAYPLKIRGRDRATIQEEVTDAATVMQIQEYLDKHPGELSGGQRQRTALARTLVQDPVAFLMDEPLSDLDAELNVEIRREIERIHKKTEVPTIYVTHDQEEAMTMSDKIVILNDGEIEQMGAPEELYSEPRNTFVARFIGNPSINLLSGEVGRDGNIELWSNGRTFQVEQGPEMSLPEGSNVTVGFRPESARLNNDEEGGPTGRISLIERIGDRKVAILDGPEGELRVTIPASLGVSEGETVTIEVEVGDYFIFDEDDQFVGRA